MSGTGQCVIGLAIGCTQRMTLVANSEVGDQCGFQNLSRRYLCSWNAIKSVALNAGWYGRGIRHQCHCWVYPVSKQGFS